MTARRLLLLHPAKMSGENRGVYIQHIASMQWVLAEQPCRDGRPRPSYAGRGRPALHRNAEWEVVAMDVLHPQLSEVALTSDLAIVHMLPGREIESLVRLRRARGLATLFEIADNFLDLGNWLPQNHTLRNPLMRQQVLYHASISDGIQVYSHGLAELYRHVHRNVVVLDPYVPLARSTRTSASFVFGWGGTTSHADDLARIAPVIVAFCRRHADAVFAYMGDAALFARLFGEIPATQTRVRAFGPYEDYLDFVSTLDAGIAALGATAFNACRTDTKFATYAARGVAAVLEDSDVYRVHADRALLFASNAELDAALESLYADPARRTAIADRAYEWAMRERSAEHLREQRLAAYEPLVPQYETQHAPVSEAPVVDFSDEATLEASVAQSPDYDQARLALAKSCESRGEKARAFALLAHEFSPLYADVAAEMQAALARNVVPDEAAHYDARVASPVARARIEHRGSDPRAYLRALLEHQPYDYVALATAIRELRADDPSSPRLAELYLRACLVAPNLVAPEHRPPSLTRYLPS